MASQPKLLIGPRPPQLDVRQISKLADRPAYFEVQRWLARERIWINELQLQLCRIPAPTFFEQERAGWFRTQLESFGWTASLDRAGNVLGTFPGAQDERHLVVSAHLDTVLAPKRPEDISCLPDGRLAGPGVSDNGSGLAALLVIARALAEHPSLHDLASCLLLVANVGEEGEGNLSGMRYVCREGLALPKIKAFIVLDGPSTEHVTAQALASRRAEISFSGPGGHSWNDHGTPNPVHALSDVISSFIQAADTRLAADRSGRCSYNFGIIEGGTSINSIPSNARAKLDLRSEAPALLEDLSLILSAIVERALETENRAAKGARLTAKIKDLGSRPGGKLPDGSPLLRTIQSVDAYLNIRSRVDCASTDANIPLSLDLPAVSIGSGGHGGGAHTSQEWYLPDGRDLGLRRILLILASLAEQNGLLRSSISPDR